MTPTEKEDIGCILMGARALIANPENWTQTAFARTKYHRATVVEHSEATKFCLVGAINFVNPDLVGNVLDFLFSKIIGQPVSRFNDTHTHNEVLEIIDEALVKLDATKCR